MEGGAGSVDVKPRCREGSLAVSRAHDTTEDRCPSTRPEASIATAGMADGRAQLTLPRARPWGGCTSRGRARIPHCISGTGVSGLSSSWPSSPSSLQEAGRRDRAGYASSIALWPKLCLPQLPSKACLPRAPLKPSRCAHRHARLPSPTLPHSYPRPHHHHSPDVPPLAIAHAHPPQAHLAPSPLPPTATTRSRPHSHQPPDIPACSPSSQYSARSGCWRHSTP